MLFVGFEFDLDSFTLGSGAVNWQIDLTQNMSRSADSLWYLRYKLIRPNHLWKSYSGSTD